MPHYLVAQLNIADRETYADYERGFMPILTKYGGTVLAVDEEAHLLEGEWPANRTVILSFATREAAMDWYTSEEYQGIAKHRFAASTGNVVMVRGFD